VVFGLMTGLGFVQPDALEQLPKDVVAFVPRLMVAAIIVILANVAASFATAALDRATARMPLHIQRQANLIVKGTIVALAVLLATSQLGIDTEVINMGVAAIFFGLAASFTLLVGLGGQGVAREVAASRALRRMLDVGDRVYIDDVTGTVQALHPTAIEVLDGSGRSILVPSSHFLNHNISVLRPSKDTPTGVNAEAGPQAGP
jgi:small-conductance mechanosensitive channel